MSPENTAPNDLGNRLVKVFDYLKSISKGRFTQEEFAESWGIKYRSLQNYFRGNQMPQFDQIMLLSKAYPQINIDWLANGKGSMIKNSFELRSTLGGAAEPEFDYIRNSAVAVNAAEVVKTYNSFINAMNKLGHLPEIKALTA